MSRNVNRRALEYGLVRAGRDRSGRRDRTRRAVGPRAGSRDPRAPRTARSQARHPVGALGWKRRIGRLRPRDGRAVSRRAVPDEGRRRPPGRPALLRGQSRAARRRPPRRRRHTAGRPLPRPRPRDRRQLALPRIRPAVEYLAPGPGPDPQSLGPEPRRRRLLGRRVCRRRRGSRRRGPRERRGGLDPDSGGLVWTDRPEALSRPDRLAPSRQAAPRRRVRRRPLAAGHRPLPRPAATRSLPQRRSRALPASPRRKDRAPARRLLDRSARRRPGPHGLPPRCRGDRRPPRCPRPPGRARSAPRLQRLRRTLAPRRRAGHPRIPRLPARARGAHRPPRPRGRRRALPLGPGPSRPGIRRARRPRLVRRLDRALGAPDAGLVRIGRSARDADRLLSGALPRQPRPAQPRAPGAAREDGAPHGVHRNLERDGPAGNLVAARLFSREVPSEIPG